MDDAVIERPSPTPIPVLSPALHCVAMTALVYLRTSFGYTFLRPKSIFFALTWAFVLFFAAACIDPDIWREYRAVCIFGAGAVVLYWIQFFRTFSREWRERAEDDHFPGTSHARRLALPVSDETLHFWGEPGAVLIVAAALRLIVGERHLSAWLVFVGICMMGREAINHWVGVRRKKAMKETVKKAEQQGDALSAERQAPAPAPKAIRKEPVKMKRNTVSPDEAHFAEILRLRPPYTLAKAEENYRTLVRLEHPDGHENSPESNAATAKLNEAIEFFRERLSG